MVPGLSGVRVTIRRLLFCALKKLGFSGILDAVQQSKALKEIHVRTKSYLPKERRGDSSGSKSTRDSISTRHHRFREC